MTCRATVARSASPAGPGFELTDLFLDLAAAGREDDFRWLARSQGVPGELVERLWHDLSAAAGLRGTVRRRAVRTG